MSALSGLAELARIVESRKQEGCTIITTNGCFDLLHAGHVHYLEEAKRLGDVLVVGVNSDASVKRIKGADRPLNPQQDRLEVVAALRVVDYAFVFDEETPVRFLEVLKPHLHVKGGDYAAEKLIERETVERNGGRVVVLPLLKGRSTTEILRRMQNKGI